MKSIRFLPLVFLIGVDGFVMFAPYVLLIMTAAYVTRLMRPEPQPIAIPVR